MAITAAMRQDIIELAVITNNAAPGTTLLAELVALADAGKTLTQIAETLVARSEFKATYPTHQTATEFGTEWIGNLLPEASAALQAECVTIVEAHINGGGTVAALLVSVQEFMSAASESDANLGTHIANFNHKVEVATYHTITSEAAAEWSIPSTVTSTETSVATGKAAVDTALTPAAAATATYALASDVSSVNEGGDVLFTLTTTNVAAGTEYSYVISGVESADISGALTGTMKVDSDGKANVSVATVADASTEGAQTMTMTVAGKTASVTVNDSSTTAAAATTPTATYALASDVSSVDEGGDVVFTLTTTNVAAGTEFSYVISGVESADISGALTGTMKVDSDGTANVSVATVADASTEGAQTMTMTVASQTASVTVNDTSTTAAASALTLDLTTAANNLSGAATDDFIDGALDSSNQTLTSSDTVDGAGGTDTLYAEISGTGTYTPTITNVETLQGNFSGAGTISLLRSSGVTTFENLDSTAAVSFTNAPSAAGVTLKSSNSSQNVTLGFTAAAGVGTSDSVDITLSNVTGGTYTLDLIETLNITSNDTANTLTALAGSKLATVNTLGTQNLTLGTLPTTTGTLDGSAGTGALSATIGKTTGSTVTGGTGKDTLTGGSGNDSIDGGAGNDTLATAGGTADTLQGGAGDDTLTLAGNLGALDVIDGGDGTDTLTVSAAVASGAAAGVTNVETLNSSLAGANQSAAVFSGITTFVSSGTGGAVGYTNTSAGQAFQITGAAPTTTTWDLATDTTSDSVTVTVGRTAGAITVTDLVVNDIETLTIATTGSSSGVTLTDLSASDMTSLTATGSKALTITEISGATGLATVDASAMTGAFKITTTNAATANGTYTGGSGADDILAGSGKDNLTGGAGNDTLEGAGGNDTYSGGAGNDTITDTGGRDSALGGDGNDTINTGDGIDTIDGGAGNDTIVFDTDGDLTGGTVLVRDSVDGGAGTDIVQVTTATAVTPYLTNVEHVDATLEGAVALNLTNATSLTSIDIETGSTAGASVTGLASGVEVDVLDADFATLDYVAGATAVVDAGIDRTATLTITDAASVTLKATAVGAGTEDFHAVALDTTDTTSLTVTGGTSTSELTTGAITATDALETLTISTSTDLATVTLGTIVDADNLTSITASGTRGAITTGAIGGTGTAEALSTITATANYGSVVTFGAITADTTNSLTENDMTITATTDSVSGSQIVFGAVTNTEGNITGTFSGGGDVDTGNLTATDVTLTISSGDTSTIADVTASDDIVVTTSGSGKVTFTAISGSDDMTFTSTSTDTVTITTIEDGIDDITIDASGATGAFIITTNSDTGSTSVMTATGGSGNDSLVGAAGADSLTGGGGNDTLTGGAANDTLTGGAGNDSITAGAGVDSIVAGDGNDTIVFAANLTGGSAGDKVDGGAGTDTVTFTVNSTTGTLSGSTLTNVEKATILFGTATGGAYSGGGSVTTQTVTATAADSTITLTNLPTNSTVTLSGDDDIQSAHIDTAAGATLTVKLGDAQDGAGSGLGDITIVDAATVTMDAAVVSSDYDDLTLDNTDTTTLTYTASGAYNLDIDDVSSTDAVTSITASTASTGTVTVDDMADADSLTSLTINAATAAINLGIMGADGAGDAAGLATIDITATKNVTTDTIFMDMAATAAGDLTSALDITVALGATGTFGAFDNEHGITNATIANSGTIASLSLLNEEAGGGATVTLSGSGTTTITSITAGTGDITITNTATGATTLTSVTSTDDATLTHSGGTLTVTEVSVTDDMTADFTGATGTLTIDIEDVGGTATVTGSAAIGFTELNLAATTASDANVTLGVNGVTDQLIQGTTSAGKITVANFVAGALASGGDAIDLDLSGIEGNSTSDLILLDDAATNVAAAQAVVIHQLAANTELDMANATADTTILMLTGTFATASMVETALETGGGNALTAKNAFAASDAFLVAWSDATNSYLGIAETGAVVDDDAKFASGDLTITVVVEFTGISTVTTLLAANFGGNIIA